MLESPFLRRKDNYKEIILYGLSVVKHQYEEHYHHARKPLAAVLVSEGDTSVCKRGETSASIKRKTFYLDYGDISKALEKFAACTRIANFLSHTDVLKLGEEFAAAYGEDLDSPLERMDFIATTSDIRLHSSQQLSMPKSVPGRNRRRNLFENEPLQLKWFWPSEDWSLTDRLRTAMKDAQFVVIEGETGSGKSTLVPMELALI